MISTNKQHALIMAGGTGGHIFPGIAVAKTLSSRGWQVSWLGSKNSMEETLVANQAIHLNLISIKGLRGNGILGWLKMPVSLTKAIFESIKIIRKNPPCVIIGFGGFVSGPGGIAAFLTRTPLLIHEQNAIAGMTNKVLSRLATQVFQAFPETFKSNAKIRTVGNPIRKEILNLREIKKSVESEKSKQIVNILVIGGSRGALSLNRLLPKVFAELTKDRKIFIRHQVGKDKLDQAKEFYAQVHLAQTNTIELFEFIDDMSEGLKWADLIISRAGASTVSEISAVGIAAIFVPYPYAVDDHQSANANWLVQSKAAFSFSEDKLEQSLFLKTLESLIDNQEEREQLANNASSVAYLKATEEIADYCENLTKNLVKDAA